MLSERVPYYILDLLQQVPSVYVEGLGRFEAIFHPAVIDMPHSRIKPPYIEPDFRDDQQLDNQTLEAYISYVSGPEVGSPKDAIKAFVRTVHDKTVDGKSYPVEKFGMFSRSSVGNIRFTPDWDAFNLSFSGLEVLDLKSQAPEYHTPLEAGETTIPVEIFKEHERLPSEVHVKEVEEIKEAVSAQLKEEFARQQEGIDQSTSRLWWVILSSALVLIAVLCAYLAWDIISNRKKLNELKQLYPGSISSTRNSDATTLTDTTPIAVKNLPLPQETIPVEEPSEQESQEAISSPCYIVVGAFTDPTNIAKMVERLKSMGYMPEEIKGGALTRVAIQTSCDQESLHKVLNEARSSINPEAWIY